MSSPRGRTGGNPCNICLGTVTRRGFPAKLIPDLRNGGQLIHASKLLTAWNCRRVLRKGGMYSYINHARNTNSHIPPGDFNHGSLSTPATFMTDD